MQFCDLPTPPNHLCASAPLRENLRNPLGVLGPGSEVNGGRGAGYLIRDMKYLVWAVLGLAGLATARAQSFDPPRYDAGTPVLSNLWVHPVLGSDAANGTSSNQPLRTLAEAWDRVPFGLSLSNHGYRILLLPGDYPESAIPTYFESRYGTYAAPVVIQAANGPGTARLHGYLNVFDCRHLHLLDFEVVTDPGYGGGGDALHLASCQYVLVRGVTLDGFDGTVNQPQETLKANQCQHLYLEDCDIGGAEQNPVDYVAVQHGHVVGCRIHDAGDWIMYVKGGSAALRIEGNEFYHATVGAFTAGQGTGFEYMVNPWLHYEAYDIKFVNNVIHHTRIAGFGVNGGYNILFAYNTLYRVGTNDHLFEAMPGGRGCDGDPAACQSNRTAGGWGPVTLGEGDPFIPNRNVYVYNNLFYNPPGAFQGWQHFNIGGPVTPPGGSGAPDPARADDNLQIRGNLIWSGEAGTPLGVEDCPGCGCQAGNPACNEAQLRAENTINTLSPQLRNPEAGDFRPAITGNVWGVTTYAIPDFPGGDRPTPPLAPEGLRSNTVPRERTGAARWVTHPPGAYTGGSSMRLGVEAGVGGTHVKLVAESNYTYRVEVSTNVVLWSALLTTNAVAATNVIIDPASLPTRIYRATLLP